MAQTFKISQLNGFFLLRIQGAHQRANFFRAAFFVELFFVLGRGENRSHFFRLVLTTALAFALQEQCVQSAISRESKQPGNEWSSRLIILIRVAPELEENILSNLLGGAGLLQDAQKESIDGAAMAVVELFEGVTSSF